jgi:uncharacterized alpha-E superfamily protein
VYWAARYLERAEDTARIVREYTNLIIDLPTSATSGWEPLLAILGHDHPIAGAVREETAVIELLVCASGNPSSIAQCVKHAREDLRRCREVIPSEAWVGVNDLHLFVTTSSGDSLDRRSRVRFLDRVIAEHQRLIGILAANMVRDSAFALMRLGRHIERADMTVRLLDVRVGSLLAERPEHERAYDDHQWNGVLRALSAVQMFHRTHREPIAMSAVVSFVLHAESFPRSVAYCLAAALEGIRSLPRAELTVSYAERSLVVLSAFDASVTTPGHLHEMADSLRRSIGQLHDRLDAVYFH